MVCALHILPYLSKPNLNIQDNDGGIGGNFCNDVRVEGNFLHCGGIIIHIQSKPDICKRNAGVGGYFIIDSYIG